MNTVDFSQIAESSAIITDVTVLSSDDIQKIRLLYNAGADVPDLIDLMERDIGFRLSKRILYSIGLRRICRDIPEPDGSPCLPEGVYGILKQEYEMRDQERREYQEQFVKSVIGFMTENPSQTTTQIASAVDITTAQARNVLKQLESSDRVMRSNHISSGRQGGRPRDYWSIKEQTQ